MMRPHVQQLAWAVGLYAASVLALAVGAKALMMLLGLLPR